MGKLSKVLVCGQVACGKTALLEQLIYGNHIVGAVSLFWRVTSGQLTFACLSVHLPFSLRQIYRQAQWRQIVWAQTGFVTRVSECVWGCLAGLPLTLVTDAGAQILLHIDSDKNLTWSRCESVRLPVAVWNKGCPSVPSTTNTSRVLFHLENINFLPTSTNVSKVRLFPNSAHVLDNRRYLRGQHWYRQRAEGESEIRRYGRNCKSMLDVFVELRCSFSFSSSDTTQLPACHCRIQQKLRFQNIIWVLLM